MSKAAAGFQEEGPMDKAATGKAAMGFQGDGPMGKATIGFIGLGLIGGSMAKGIKRSCPQAKIMAYMRSREKLEQAKKDQVIDLALDGIDEHLGECDFIVLSTPVEYNAAYLAAVQPYLKPGAILTDVGSTKTHIHQAAADLGLEGCFIGGHPMAGSEKTGYENSTDHLLENAYYLITPTGKSSQEAVDRMVGLAKTIGAIPMVLDFHEHDYVAAAISHLPHVIASSLVNLVRDCDNDQELMKQLAAGGFKDITRIASSSPQMWEQICMANSQNLAAVLERYIASLNHVLGEIKAHDALGIRQLFETSRTYRNSFSGHSKGAVEADYSFTVDIVDEPGAISTLSVILAAKGISIRNIGINHNRERGEGALRISFYGKEAMEAAWRQLKKYHYELIGN